MDPGVLLRNWSSAIRIASHYDRPSWRDDCKVEVHWGVTGAGKSHTVYSKLRDENIPFYEKSSLTKWWDGYDGEKVVVMDEFCGIINVQHILKWWDKYPCNVEIKGGTCALKATTFYVMSNKSPDEWYANDDKCTMEQMAAMKRRLTQTFHYTRRHDDDFNIFD